MTASSPASGGRIGDLARALVRGMGWRQLAALAIGVIVGPLLSVVVAVAISLLTPFGAAWGSWPAPWFAIGDVVLALSTVLTWQAAEILLMPVSLRGPMEVQTWAGERALRAWQAAAGAAFHVLPPTSRAAAERWLRGHPETERNRAARIEVLLVARRFDEARAALARLRVESAADRIAHADLLATLTFLERGELELEPLRAATAEAPAEARLDGLAALAILEARAALAAGEEWRAPLSAMRSRLGGAADGVLWRGYFLRRMILLIPIALVVAFAFGVLGLALDPTSMPLP
jgi:hypothetical protein